MYICMIILGLYLIKRIWYRGFRFNMRKFLWKIPLWIQGIFLNLIYDWIRWRKLIFSEAIWILLRLPLILEGFWRYLWWPLLLFQGFFHFSSTILDWLMKFLKYNNKNNNNKTINKIKMKVKRVIFLGVFEGDRVKMKNNFISKFRNLLLKLLMFLGFWRLWLILKD